VLIHKNKKYAVKLRPRKRDVKVTLVSKNGKKASHGFTPEEASHLARTLKTAAKSLQVNSTLRRTPGPSTTPSQAVPRFGGRPRKYSRP
jgi:hypothetical protein